MVKLKIPIKDNEKNEEDEVSDESILEYIKAVPDIIQSLAKDADVSLNVKRRPSLIPVDSHKIDFGRVPGNLAEYLERLIELQIMIEEMSSSNDEEWKFLESYNILSKVRIYSAYEGWLLNRILGLGGRK